MINKRCDWGQSRIELLKVKLQISEMISNGYPLSKIYSFLYEDGSISIKKQTFYYAVKHYILCDKYSKKKFAITNNKTSVTNIKYGEINTTSDKSSTNSVGMGGFVHDPTAGSKLVFTVTKK